MGMKNDFNNITKFIKLNYMAKIRKCSVKKRKQNDKDLSVNHSAEFLCSFVERDIWKSPNLKRACIQLVK